MMDFLGGNAEEKEEGYYEGGHVENNNETIVTQFENVISDKN